MTLKNVLVGFPVKNWLLEPTEIRFRSPPAMSVYSVYMIYFTGLFYSLFCGNKKFSEIYSESNQRDPYGFFKKTSRVVYYFDNVLYFVSGI